MRARRFQLHTHRHQRMCCAPVLVEPLVLWFACAKRGVDQRCSVANFRLLSFSAQTPPLPTPQLLAAIVHGHFARWTPHLWVKDRPHSTRAIWRSGLPISPDLYLNLGSRLAVIVPVCTTGVPIKRILTLAQLLLQPQLLKIPVCQPS